MGTDRDQLKKKQKNEYTTPTYRYLILCFIPGTAVCSKESTTQHYTAPQRRARHGTARHGAALLSYIIKIKIHLSCEIEDFVETYLCKLCVIL